MNVIALNCYSKIRVITVCKLCEMSSRIRLGNTRNAKR